MNPLSALDIWLFYFINNAPHTSLTDLLARLVSGFTANGLLWFVLAVIIFIYEVRRDLGLFFRLLSAGIIGILVSEFILKPLIARPRPYLTLPDVILPVGPLSDYSFPSTHTLLAVALTLIFIKYRPRWRLACWVLVGLVIWSRIYLGYHYPSDILAGALLGWIIGKLVISYPIPSLKIKRGQPARNACA